MESSSSQSSSSSFGTACLHYLNIIRTGLLQLQQQLSPSSWLQSKTKDAESLREKSRREAFAEESRENFRLKVSRMRDEFGVVPGLATIPVGNIKESQNYLTLKKTCKLVGIKLYESPLPDDSTEEQVIECIKRSRVDPCVHYTLIPCPLPHHMDKQKISVASGRLPRPPGRSLQPYQFLNMQKQQGRSSRDVMKNCIQGFKNFKIDIEGKRVVVIGLRNFFANTDWQLLERECACVIYVRVSEMYNCKDIIKEADIFILAATEDHSLLSLRKPGSVLRCIDTNTMHDEKLIDTLLITALAYAYTREMEYSKSKNMTSS